MDMFPHTEHIEVVCALSKLDIHQKITVDLKMDELDVTAAETKATYEEIREYVKEHTGLNVSASILHRSSRSAASRKGQIITSLSPRTAASRNARPKRKKPSGMR